MDPFAGLIEVRSAPGQIVGGKPVGEIAAFLGQHGLGIDRALVTHPVPPLRLGKRRIESPHHGTAQRAALGRLHGQEIDHMAAPVLVVRPIANKAHTMRGP